MNLQVDLLSSRILSKQTFKEELVQQGIESAWRRFHQLIEGSVLEDMKCLFALAS
ncbi:MAG: hypothetical protein ACRDFB_05430 [Rhabdochlamydiaceae bacterium]